MAVNASRIPMMIWERDRHPTWLRRVWRGRYQFRLNMRMREWKQGGQADLEIQ